MVKRLDICLVTANLDASLKDCILTIDMPKTLHAKAVRLEPKAA
jgi:hypothetical protein